MWMNFNAVFYIDRSFQADTQTAALFEFTYISNLYMNNNKNSNQHQQQQQHL